MYLKSKKKKIIVHGTNVPKTESTPKVQLNLVYLVYRTSWYTGVHPVHLPPVHPIIYPQCCPFFPDACLRRLRVCAAMHGCTHTVLVSTYSVSVVRHVLPIRIAPKTSSPCCKVAAVDLIGRLCYRLAVTFGAVSRKFPRQHPVFSTVSCLNVMK